MGRRVESDLAKDILDNKTGITALPIPEGGVQATYLEVKPIMLSAFAADKDAAWELVKFITSKDKMAQWLIDSGGIPARTDSLESQEFIEAEIGWWLQGFADQPTSVAMAPINWGPVSEANIALSTSSSMTNGRQPKRLSGSMTRSYSCTPTASCNSRRVGFTG